MRSQLRFPAGLLAAHVALALLAWAGLLVVAAIVTAVYAGFRPVTGSSWAVAAQLPRWLCLFVGMGLARQYLPMSVAHGQTRRRFAGQAAVVMALFAPCVAGLVTAGYLLEHLLYGLTGWPQTLNQSHLFTTATQAGLVFTEYLVEYLAWTVAGALVGAAHYRWGGNGLLALPLGLGLVLAAAEAAGTELRLPFLLGRLGIDVDVPRSAPWALAAGAGVFLVGLALTWPIIRDMPLRNRRA